MSINSEALQRKLYDLLDNKGYNPKPMDATGKVTPVPEEAAVIKFDFIKDGENYGKVWISIDGSKKLKIYYGDNVSDSPSDNTSGTQYSDSWTALLNHLKNWAQRRQLSFELRNENHLEADMAQRDHMDKKERISEGYYPMGKSASYSDAVPSVKIVIEHSRKIEEGEQRYRNINRIFVENAAGERFLLNTTKPGIARVYARHIAEGGTPYDDRGQHIKGLVEEYSKMAGFVRATKSGQFNESTQKLIAEGVNHYNNLRETLSRMSSKRGYDMYFESWTPSLMEDDSDTSSINELFVQETVDPRIESAMPILAKLSKNIHEMTEVSELAEWADSLLEGGDGGEASEEKDGDTPGDAGQGTAGDVDDEENLSEGENEALNPQGIPEGRLDGSDEIDSPVANAITRRILMQRVDLLSKYGPEAVANAIGTVADDMGDWIGPDDEIGSSDVSAWVKRVESQLGGLTEAPGAETLAHNQSTEAGNLKAFDLEEGIADDYEDMSDRELIRHAGMLGLEKNVVPDDEGGLANRREIIRLLQQEAEGDLDEGIIDKIKDVGQKALNKLGHGSDDDLLADLKKRAGVRNSENGKPSMAHSDVEKVDEVSQDLAQRAFAKRTSHAWDLGDMSTSREDDAEADKASAKADKTYDRIGKRWGKDAQKMADRAADREIYGGDLEEDLDADQKRAGQWGPTGGPAKIGNLVGESKLDEMDSQGYKGTRDSDDEGGKGESKATPIKAKDMAKKGEKALDKAMDDAHKKEVKEGQEDLDALLKLLGK